MCSNDTRVNMVADAYTIILFCPLPCHNVTSRFTFFLFTLQRVADCSSQRRPLAPLVMTTSSFSGTPPPCATAPLRRPNSQSGRLHFARLENNEQLHARATLSSTTVGTDVAGIFSSNPNCPSNVFSGTLRVADVRATCTGQRPVAHNVSRPQHGHQRPQTQQQMRWSSLSQLGNFNGPQESSLDEPRVEPSPASTSSGSMLALRLPRRGDGGSTNALSGNTSSSIESISAEPHHPVPMLSLSAMTSSSMTDAPAAGGGALQAPPRPVSSYKSGQLSARDAASLHERERHRVEVDGLWKRLKAAQTALQAEQTAHNASVKLAADAASAAALEMNELTARHALVADAADGFAGISCRLQRATCEGMISELNELRRLLRIAAAKEVLTSTLPPSVPATVPADNVALCSVVVKDSDLLRALRQSEEKYSALVAELQQRGLDTLLSCLRNQNSLGAGCGLVAATTSSPSCDWITALIQTRVRQQPSLLVAAAGAKDAAPVPEASSVPRATPKARPQTQGGGRRRTTYA